MADYDGTSLLMHTSLPSLILCGDKDWANKKSARVLAELIPQSSLIMLAGGHQLNCDKPDEFAYHIRNFVEQLKTS